MVYHIIGMPLSFIDTLPASLGAQLLNKLEKDKDNAKTKEKSEEDKSRETTPLPSSANTNNPQVEFSSQSGPGTPR